MNKRIKIIKTLAYVSLTNFKRIADSCETIEQFSSGLTDYGIQLANNLRRLSVLIQPNIFYRAIYHKKIEKIINQFYSDFVSVLFENQMRLNKPKIETNK